MLANMMLGKAVGEMFGLNLLSIQGSEEKNRKDKTRHGRVDLTRLTSQVSNYMPTPCC